MERDRGGARSRSRRPRRPRLRVARHLERHHRLVPGRRQRHPHRGRIVRPAGVRPRPQPARLSRLRRLPRRAAHRRIDQAATGSVVRRAARRGASVPRTSVPRGDCREAGKRRAIPRGARPHADAVAGRAQGVQRTRKPPHRAPARRPRRDPERNRSRGALARRRTAASGNAASTAARGRAGRARRAATRARGRAPRRSRGLRPAPDPRPPAGRRPGLPARQADLCQPRLPRLDRLRRARRAGRGRRPRRTVRGAFGGRSGPEQRREIADHRHQQGRPGAGQGAAVHLAVERRVGAGADADRRRRRRERGALRSRAEGRARRSGRTARHPRHRGRRRRADRRQRPDHLGQRQRGSPVRLRKPGARGLAVREPAHPGQPAHRGRHPQTDRPAGASPPRAT